MTISITTRFCRHTASGGQLCIGHSETLGRDSSRYEYVMPAACRRM